VVKYQDPAAGLWYQVVDQGPRQGNYLEATASAMFVYTLAKGVNHGLVSRDCVPVLLKGYTGIVERLIKAEPTGRISLTQCCSVAGLGYGRDGSYEYYVKEPVVDNDLKGVGPFILAGIELQDLVGPAQTAAQAADRPDEAQAPQAKTAGAPEWSMVPEILARIKAPVFAQREFAITAYGAATDGLADSTEALRKAIEACSAAGGGRVTVPAGVFLTGPIRLKSRVELHLDGGATLRFKTDPKAYLPAVLTRFEGMECYNYSPLIYALDEQDIAVTGDGVLDGQADEQTWWSWKGRKEFGAKQGSPNQQAARDRLIALVDQNAPVEQRRFGEGDYLRSSFIQPYRCRAVLIEGVRIIRSPMWEINPVLCTNVTIRGVTVTSHGPNNDGCDPESCRDVLIEDCVFDTGDDCIAIKSGRDNDGRRVAVPAENIVIRGCTMKDGHGGVVMGSEISGGCRNVFVEHCRMDSPNLDRALRFKSNARRGGAIENVFMRDVQVGRVAEAVLTVDFLYETGAKGPYRPSLRRVVLEDVTSASSPRVMWVAGFPGATIDGIEFVDSTFRGVNTGEVLGQAGSVLFRNVRIEPAKGGRSLNSPAAVQ
jgi:unsaturated rhamnogalacturonyl hydrolase